LVDIVHPYAAAGVRDDRYIYRDHHWHLANLRWFVMLDYDDLRRGRNWRDGSVDGSLIRGWLYIATAVNHRQNDALADAGFLELLDRCRVNGKHRSINLDQREENLFP
jgi:hypothetical protein